MNVNALLQECYRRLNFTTPTPALGIQQRLLGFLSDAHRRLLSAPGMEGLRDETTTVTSVINQARLALPPTVARVRAVIDPVNQVRLRAMRRSDARRLNPGVVGVSGTPDFYVPVGQEHVAAQPAAATGLWVVSTSAIDAGYVDLTVTTTGGYQHTPNLVTLSGTTRAQAGTRTDITQVSTFSLQAAATGYVSLYTAAVGGTELARIEPGRLGTKYFIVELLPTPSAAVTYTIDYTRILADFQLSVVEEPLIPEDFHYLLVVMACRREYLFNDDKARYTQYAIEEQEGMRALRAFVLYPPDYRVKNNDPEQDGGDDYGSNLGGAFPAGRW